MTEPIEAHEEYPELFQLIAGFFNEDWFDEYPDEAAALADYTSQTREATRREALAELVRLRSDAASEADLAVILRHLGSGYAPRNPPTPLRDFVDRLIRGVTESLGP